MSHSEESCSQPVVALVKNNFTFYLISPYKVILYVCNTVFSDLSPWKMQRHFWIQLSTSMLNQHKGWEPQPSITWGVSQPGGVVMSMLTTYLAPNTCLSTPRLRYYVPKINTHQLSSFTELYCHCHNPIKSFAAGSLPKYVATHSLLTGYLCP